MLEYILTIFYSEINTVSFFLHVNIHLRDGRKTERGERRPPDIETHIRNNMYAES